ncbi:hypothetical protein K8R66_00885, partial [bacterium]|nr:hypothetical protein [bacterium]
MEVKMDEQKTWRNRNASASTIFGKKVHEWVSITLWSFLGLVLFITLITGKLFYYNPASQILVKQAWITGDLSVKSTNGFIPILLGDVWKFPRETSVKFTNKSDEKNVTTAAVFVRYNDGGTGYMGGSARFKNPVDNLIFKVLKFFGNWKTVVLELFVPGIREISTSTDGLMSTDETYTTNRSMIAEWCSEHAT